MPVYSQNFNILDNPTDINALLSMNTGTVCRVPMGFEITNTGEIEKLTNIGSAERVNIENSGGTIIINNYVFIKEEGNTPLYSPSESEKYHRVNFEETSGIKFDVQKEINDLKEDVEEWNKRLLYYAEELNKITDFERKKEGFEILKMYKENMDTANCLIADYGEEAIVNEDSSGNKEYLFNLEKIKNDPNYYFIGEESEGFSVAKKFNRFGYLSHSDKQNDIRFKYTSCKPFYNGYAIASDNENRFVIDKSGKEILTFNRIEVDSITVLINGVFIVHNNPSYGQRSHLVKNTGEIISKMYHSITKYDESKLVLLAKKTNRDVVIGNPITNEISFEYTDHFIDINGNEFIERLDCKNTFKACSFSKRKCDFVIKNIMVIPNSNNALFVFKLDENYIRHLAVINLENNNILQCAQSDTWVWESELHYFPIEYMSESFNYNSDTDIIIGITNNLQINYAFELNKDKTITPYKGKDQRGYGKIKQSTFFNLSKNKEIGSPCYFPQGVISEKNLLIFGDILINDGRSVIGYGVMDYYGLNLIPPIFKEIIYDANKDSNLIVTDYFGTKYEINTVGECKGNCDEYYIQTKNYFTLVETLDEQNRTKPKKPILISDEFYQKN